MTERDQPTDLELAALISSKICHDVIGPVGAIYNGLEILDEDDDAEAKNYALDVIRNVTQQASARLQFARFAFGAAGSAGAQIELATAEQISRGLVGQGKHNGSWRAPVPRGRWPGQGWKLLPQPDRSALGAATRDPADRGDHRRQPGEARLRLRAKAPPPPAPVPHSPTMSPAANRRSSMPCRSGPITLAAPPRRRCGWRSWGWGRHHPERQVPGLTDRGANAAPRQSPRTTQP
jgi:hypothetical protein